MKTTIEMNATNKAFRMICSANSAIVLKSYNRVLSLKKRLDLRTNFDKIVLSKLQVLNANLDFAEISNKQKTRRNNSKYAFSNFLDNPIVKDYFKNKNDIRFMNSERIIFYSGRNHWAKNETDRNILNIFLHNQKKS